MLGGRATTLGTQAEGFKEPPPRATVPLGSDSPQDCPEGSLKPYPPASGDGTQHTWACPLGGGSENSKGCGESPQLQEAMEHPQSCARGEWGDGCDLRTIAGYRLGRGGPEGQHSHCCLC